MHVYMSLFQILVLFSLYRWPLIAAKYPSNGMGLEYCRKKEDCAGSRQCYHVPEGRLRFCNASAKNCICRFNFRERCSSSAECPDGERCFVIHGYEVSEEVTACWSCRFQLSEKNSFVDENPSSCDDVWLGGYTGDICSDYYFECAGKRKCQEFLEDGSLDLCSRGTQPCFCWSDSLQVCHSSRECENGERCAEDGKDVTACFSCGRVEADNTFTAIDKDAICMTPSPTMTATASPTQSPSPSASLVLTIDDESSLSPSAPLISQIPPAPQPCIAVAHLLHVEQRDLIFREHIQAAVLCDHRGSCSTPGHMLVYRGVPMSMRSYCSRYTKCTKRIALVNNHRMRRAFLVTSNTDMLHFTVFSARYETRLEESLLRLAIAFGM